jgi:hypothetical protein
MEVIVVAAERSRSRSAIRTPDCQALTVTLSGASGELRERVGFDRRQASS